MRRDLEAMFDKYRERFPDSEYRRKRSLPSAINQMTC